ncbi:O-methyltransferase [Pararhodonellum marinum]|uniref:O-methyltransferase n=1 Tax=Pararhodonellum marinum TaxID=2755358 RepID=UPI00188FFCB2|nr:class I SAM-dependent methyltransferase [Pararhodonellum marinum]
MNNPNSSDFPKALHSILADTDSAGFTMASEPLTGSLLKTLAASKRGSRFLELGTGTGISTAWILAGMDQKSSLISVDHDMKFLDIAQKHLGNDTRLTSVCEDGGQWLKRNKGDMFDFIFADTWHGKFLMLDETLDMLHKGGFYIIDDLLPQSNWPEGHQDKVHQLIDTLEARKDLVIAKMNWATGLIVATKI